MGRKRVGSVADFSDENLEIIVKTRVYKDIFYKINKILNKDKRKKEPKYDNLSHFFRCSIMKLVREEEKKGRK